MKKMIIDRSEATKVDSTLGLKDWYWATKAGYVYKVTDGETPDKPKVKKMSPFITKDGYVEYVLTKKDGSKLHKQAQLLILPSFKPKPKNKGVLEANHEDKNRQNNALRNLNWKTPSQNIKHSFDNGKVIWNKGKKKQPDGSFR